MKDKTIKVISVLLSIFLLIGSLCSLDFHAEQEEWNFGCSGKTETFTAPKTGLYYIQSYGGSGGNNTNAANYGGGGYANGEIVLKQGDTLYITVGGKGIISSSEGTVPGGYNGGGNATGYNSGSGGGATLVAFKEGNIASLQNDEIISIASGGGGKSKNSTGIYQGASGGGSVGGYSLAAAPGTQFSGYEKGRGESGNNGYGAGGAGYYGGFASSSSSYGGAGGSGYTNEDVLRNSDMGISDNWFEKDGMCKITYKGTAVTSVTISAGANGFIDGKEQIVLSGEIGTSITIPTPTPKESYIKFDGYVCSGGDGTLEGLTYTFGYKNTFLDATYSGQNVQMNISQKDSLAYVSVSSSSVKESLIYLKGSDDRQDWTTIATFLSGKNDEITNKTRKSYSSGQTGTYTVPLSGIYRIYLLGAGGGADGGFKGGSGANMTFTAHFNTGDILKFVVAKPGTDSDANRSMKAGGTGWNKGGDGGWSGGGGGSTGVSINGKTLAIASGGGGGNWSVGFGGRKSTDNTGNNGNNPEGERGDYFSDYDSAGGGAGWVGGKKGISENKSGTRGAYGGRNGYNSALVTSFVLEEDKAGTNGGGRTNGAAYVQPVSFDIPIGSLNSSETITINVPDVKAPDIPNSSQVVKRTDKEIVLWFNETKDYGGQYFVQIPGYTNIEELTYVSGFKGWYYIIDTNSSTIVTTDNGTFTEKENTTISSSNAGKYVHVAAIDNAGNISDTYTFQIPNDISYTVNHYLQNLDDDLSYTLEETETFEGIVNTTVSPSVKQYDGFVSPEVQEITLTQGSENVVNYYYVRAKRDVTFIDVIDDINGQELGRTSKTYTYGQLVSGEDIGNDHSDNAYYNGYYYDSCTTATLLDKDITVYRIFKLRTFDIKGSVTWIDKDNEYNSRPDEVTIYLYRDGEVVNQVSGLTENNVCSFNFDTLQKYDTNDGHEYEYTVTQSEAISKNAPEDKYVTTQNVYNFTNKLDNNTSPTPTDDIGFTIKGNIIWEDYFDKYGLRPKKVTITLYQDGEYYEEKEVLNDYNKYKFTNLPKYRFDENDVLIDTYKYTVEETFSSVYLKKENGKYVETFAYRDPVVTKTDEGFDFTNILDVEGSIISVKPEYINTLTFKHNTTGKVSVTLKQLETIIDGDNLSYSNNYSDIFYNLEVEQLGTSLSGLPSGKYEISVSEDLVLDNATISDINNVSLVKENNKYYVIIAEVPSDTWATITLEFSKNHNGYKSSYDINNLWKTENPNAMSDLLMISVISDEIEAPVLETYEITYENSNTADDNIYTDEDDNNKAIILDFVPLDEDYSDLTFVGWSETENDDKAEYFPLDEILLDRRLKLYPVFEKKESITDNTYVDEEIFEDSEEKDSLDFDFSEEQIESDTPTKQK